MREFHVSRGARDRYGLSDALFGLHGGVLVADVAGARRLAAGMNEARATGRVQGAPTITAGDIFALGVIHEICHHVVAQYDARVRPGAIGTAAAELDSELGEGRVRRVVDTFATEFPTGDPDARPHGAGADRRERRDDSHAAAVEELLLLALTNSNPAAEPLRELFDDTPLATTTDYPIVLARLEAILDAGPPVEPGGQPLVAMLRAPMLASPTSLAGQLRYIRERWPGLLGGVAGLLDRLLTGLDVITEEERALHFRFGGGGGPGPAEAPTLSGLDTEPERFSSDSAWMPRVVLLAKSTYVWLDQLSRSYGRDIRTLDAIPDEELDTLAARGITGLWLIGLWQRSAASQRIKQLRGNLDAVASAYSLDEYRIADDLGGEDAYANLRGRAWSRGIRLASDMVPNHMGIDSRWVVEHPDWFISLAEP